LYNLSNQFLKETIFMKRFLSFLLTAMLLTALITGCAGSGSGDEKPTLVMATNASFPPFEFVNEQGEFDGFDVHLARAIADVLGRELVISDMEFTAALAAVTTGQADVAIAAITIRPDRLETMDFSTPYFQTDLVVVVPQDSDIVNIIDLRGEVENDEGEMVAGAGAGMRVAVQFGTTSDIFVSRVLSDSAITRLNRAPDTVLELNNNRVDAIVIDREVANMFLADNQGLRILDEALGSENYGIAMNKGSDLLAPINDALQTLKNNGEYERIFNMFFGGAEE
jgi:polar amino acid transport system substrate-binding protein